MSHFLNQRTTAGFNSFSARKPRRLSFQPTRALLPLPPRVRVADTALGFPGCSAPPITCSPPIQRGRPPHPSISCSQHPKAPQRGSAAPPRGWDPHGEGGRGAGIPTARGEGVLGSPRPRTRGISAAIRFFATLFFFFPCLFPRVIAFAVTRGNVSGNLCLFLDFLIFFFLIRYCSRNLAAAKRGAGLPRVRALLPRSRQDVPSGCGSSMGEKHTPAAPLQPLLGWQRDKSQNDPTRVDSLVWAPVRSACAEGEGQNNI